MKEAKARIKINKLLEQAGWRFFDNEKGPANISLEQNVKITKKDIDFFGENFESTKNGYVDFLLLDPKGFPFVVLEAKSESISPLDGKEQARKYAMSLNARFVILSNGNAHFLWDLKRGNPELITEIPTQELLMQKLDFCHDNKTLAREEVKENYIALTQKYNFDKDPNYLNQKTRPKYLQEQNLSILRAYQLNAIHALQKAAEQGKDRFLFEMATGTGKTLISAAIIKLFLRSGSAKRVLFLVDRLELEKQAYKNFEKYLKKDYQSVIYKKSKDDWNKAEIVISTVQSLAAQDKYKKLFSPTDFDLLIADECHRSIGENNHIVFEYFIGYKLGLTATPKHYLKNIDNNPLPETSNEIRDLERRQILDTYKIFGCEDGEPTFCYSLQEGIKENYLINPVVSDARTEITTELLSKKGYAVLIKTETGEKEEGVYFHKDFERKFFSEKTNQVFCKTFIEHAFKDSISGEIGKSIVFCISQNHASKITQILNQIAQKKYPNKYNSDFAVQVTSNIKNCEDCSKDFANNNLKGRSKFLENYKTSKARVCVTVGMMTTGYDCPDILNLALMRPIFSPTNFVQIKGRGTRKFTFKHQNEQKEQFKAEKIKFKLFDFFGNCEYFEKEFDYDEILKLSITRSDQVSDGVSNYNDEIEVFDPDQVKTYTETSIGAEGMRVDRKLFEKAKAIITNDKIIKDAVEKGQQARAIQAVREKYEDQPELYLTLEKLRKSEGLDRKISWWEVLQRMFGLIDYFKTKDELLELECNKFIMIKKPDIKYILAIKNFFKVYITDKEYRNRIDNGGDLHHYVAFSFEDYKSLNGWKKIIPEYVKDYVSFNIYE